MTIVTEYFGSLVQGTGVTLQLLLVGGGVALGLGLILALLRWYGPWPLRWVITGYIELMRGLPPILQLFILYFGLEQVGIYFSAFAAALWWLLLLGGGYAAEVFRGGLEGVEAGQKEAAAALGMGTGTILRRVILPQAIGAMLAPLTNFVVVQLKNTTLVYFIGVPDIMYHARLGVGATSRPFPIYGLAALFYIAITLVLTRAGAFLERRVQAYQ
jgi:polar amino acid transport system permease protein